MAQHQGESYDATLSLFEKDDSATEEHNATLGVLECLVDRFGLATVLSALAGVCHDKAKHLLVYQQDAQYAGTWLRDGNKLNQTALTLDH